MILPKVGFGTYRIREEEDVLRAIRSALACGYRLFDCATSYKNERHIGDALQKCLPELGLCRGDIFITSKLSPSAMGGGKQVVVEAVKRSILEFGPVLQGYIDLYLVHWPAPSKNKPDSLLNKKVRRNSWLSLMDCRRDGLVRDIGVSNYTKKHLMEFFDDDDINGGDGGSGVHLHPPLLNQIELHPLSYGSYKETIDFCKEKKILIQSYSTLGMGLLLGDSFRKLLAANGYDSTDDLDLVLLMWALNHDFLIIPKSSNPIRIERNFSSPLLEKSQMIRVPMDVLDTLSSFDVVKGFNERGHCCWDPFIVE